MFVENSRDSAELFFSTLNKIGDKLTTSKIKPLMNLGEKLREVKIHHPDIYKKDKEEIKHDN